jgi:magnesium-transporting ATPase (P-type)
LVDSVLVTTGAVAFSVAFAESFATNEKLEKLNNNPRIIFEKYIFFKKVLIGIVILAFTIL